MENNQMNFLGENSAEKELKALQKQVARKEFIIDELSSPKSKQKEMAVFTHAKKTLRIYLRHHRKVAEEISLEHYRKASKLLKSNN